MSTTVELFRARLATENYSTAFIQVLITVIESTEHKTFQELNEFIKREIEGIRSACDIDRSILSYRNPICLDSVASYFKLIIKKTNKKYGSDLESFKVGLLKVSKEFLDVIDTSTKRIVQNSREIFKPMQKILTYSYSRSVISAIRQANSRFGDIQVFVCETHPYKEGYRSYTELRESGVDCKVILDNEVNTYIDRVDVVLVGAQTVLENGAIISRVGTSILALVAHCKNKPLYVFAESYKFSRSFLLNAFDMPQEYLKVEREHPVKYQLNCSTVDFTDPKYIHLVCTDLGMFTTAEVSDGLIKIFR